MHIRVSWPILDTLEAGSWFCQDAPGLNCSSDTCNFSTGRAPRRMRYTDLTWNLLHPTSWSSSPTKTRRTRHKTNNWESIVDATVEKPLKNVMTCTVQLRKPLKLKQQVHGEEEAEESAWRTVGGAQLLRSILQGPQKMTAWRPYQIASSEGPKTRTSIARCWHGPTSKWWNEATGAWVDHRCWDRTNGPLYLNHLERFI